MWRAIAPTLCVCTALAAAQARPVAVFSYDSDLNGEGPAGVVVGTPEGTPVLAPGKVGQALKCGPSFGNVAYPSAGLLRRESGTIEMWVCAVDWASDEPKFHVFFETRGQGALYLYEYWTSNRLLMLTCPEVEGPYVSSQIDSDFKPGEWHHLAGTWSPRGVMVYLDAKPAASQPLPGDLPRKLGDTFRIGDEEWQFPRETSSLVDEVRLYDRALTPQHIAAHMAGNYDFSVPLEAKTASLTAEIDPIAYQVSARLDTGGADVADDRVQVSFGLGAPGGAPGAATSPVQAGAATAALPFPSREPGTHSLTARVLLDGGQAFEVARDITIPRTDWLGNGIGRQDVVLPPWTPLEVSGTDVSVWGRTYGFGSSAAPVAQRNEAELLEQVTTAGAQILSRPLGLTLVAGGREVPWRDGQTQLLEATPTRARLIDEQVAVLDERPVRFRTAITAEYDGLVLLEVTCENPGTLVAEAMSLEMPVKAEHALYRHRYAASWIPTSGNVPAGEGVVEKTPWVPFCWLGDNDRGLFWFTESDEMWPNGRAENALEIVRQACPAGAGQEIVLRLNLLAEGQKLPANWKLVFGLQATPVKPLPRDWRKWRMSALLAGGRGMTRQNVEIVWPQATRDDSLAAFGFPEAKDPEKFGAAMKGLHDGGLLTVPYLCLTYVREDLPEWEFFRRIWAMGPVDPSIPEAGWGHTFAMVSPNGAGYQDFILARTKEFVEKYGIDGSYHDQTHPYMSSAVEAGVGYERDGRRSEGTPILGYRELYRRNYALFKGLARPTFLQAHMSGKVTIPVLAYEDSYLDGEHFRGEVKDSYLDVMTLDSFRCEYMGRQWGLMPFFLPEFREPWSSQVEPTRGLMALLMIHDTNIWPIWCNSKVVDDAFVALDAFGYVDSEFLPYYDPHPPASTDLKDVYVSGYRKADGSVLLVVANLGREDRNGPVQVDLQRLGLRSAAAVSWPDKAALAMENGALALEIPRLGYRMVVVAQSPDR
jgi:hypothetical protein